MLTKLEIKNFRGFENLEIANLQRVNLILGQSNTGKTAILEALAYLNASNAGARDDVARTFRRESEEFWKWFFFNQDWSHPAKLHCQFVENGKESFGAIQLTSHGPSGGRSQGLPSGSSYTELPVSDWRRFPIHIFSTNPRGPSEDAVAFNRVVLKRRKKEIEQLLRKIEPRLVSIEALQAGHGPLIYVELLGLKEMFPVTQMGQGFNRLLNIYSEIVVAEAKIFLIDEVENGLHHSILPTVWTGIFHAARELDVQVFATTHSWECVLAADAAAREGKEYDLSLIRLDRTPEGIKATQFGRETMETAKELHWEMR